MSAAIGAPVGKGSWPKIIARQLAVSTSTTVNSHPGRIAGQLGTLQAKGSWARRMTPLGAKKGTAAHGLFDSGRVH